MSNSSNLPIHKQRDIDQLSLITFAYDTYNCIYWVINQVIEELEATNDKSGDGYNTCGKMKGE